MADMDDNLHSKMNWAGILLALLFYIWSVVMVTMNASPENRLIPAGEYSLTIAHWQLEDGFRKGIEHAAAEYSKIKAAEGMKVRILQSTVPIRGYPQWFVTQLISGNPADIIELHGNSKLLNRYFIPLSNAVARPNPYNRGTPLEGIPWKDTYVDNMNSGFSPVYAEYFGIGLFFHVMRVYVNTDLVRRATGSAKLPATFEEWMESCAKLKEYGRRVGKPIIPIGVRGLEKSTVEHFFSQYFSQLNGNLNDELTVFGEPCVGSYTLLAKLADGSLPKDRLLHAVELTKTAGQYFSDGFTTADLEQTKFLFFTGNVAYFPEGTWDAWSLVNNSPFPVDVITIPAIGPGNPFYRDFTGRISELGIGVGGQFGITKASRNPELALDFLRFLSSYRMNQKVMMDFCKWPPAVIKADYKGLLKNFKPVSGDARLPVRSPFYLGLKSKTKMMEAMERIIVGRIPDAKEYFWNAFLSNLPYLVEETGTSIADHERLLFELETLRNSISAGLLRKDLTPREREQLELRRLMSLENSVDRWHSLSVLRDGLSSLLKLEESERKNGN